MHTLDTYDLVFNSLVVVMMPFIIWANLRTAGLKSPVHEYLWREHTNFMRVALVILGLLTLFSVCALLANFGLISPAVEETTAMAIGIPFLVASVAIIWLAVVGALRVFRDWRGGRLGT